MAAIKFNEKRTTNSQKSVGLISLMPKKVIDSMGASTVWKKASMWLMSNNCRKELIIVFRIIKVFQVE